MAKTYYSQHGEDCLLWEFFESTYKGFYIDVGAFDGKHLSNTYIFDDNWKGICVEPEYQYFQRCDNRRKATCFHAAAVHSPSINTVTFTIMNEGGLGSGVEVTEKKKNRGRFTYSVTQVPAKTLNQMLDKCPTYQGNIDILSIDVEGTEIQVLQGLDFSTHSPRVIIAEGNNKQKRKELDEYIVGSLGYLYAGSMSVNRFYVRNKEDLTLIQSIDVSCTLKTNHPTHQGHTTDKDRNVQVKLKTD